MTVYVLVETFEGDSYTPEPRVLGIYSTNELAVAARQRHQEKTGYFRDTQMIQIEAREVDKDEF